MSFFKYAPPERVNVIQNLTIRFSPPDEFNDPFELLPETKLIETQEWLDSMKKELPQLCEEEIERRFLQRMPVQKQIALQAMQETRRVNRILSLAKTAPDDPRALLLWGHYTQNHSGMVFEFDDTHAWVRWHDRKKGEPHDRADVLYRRKRSGWNGMIPVDEFLYTKSEHWIYEQEVRLMRFIGDKDFDTSKVDALVRFPPDLLLSVTIGVNNTSEKAVRDALNANPNLSHVVLRKAELHTDEFKLVLTVLPR